MTCPTRSLPLSPMRFVSGSMSTALIKNGLPVSDILQVWLDVGQHPAQGKEQADLIWRKILAPAFESSER